MMHLLGPKSINLVLLSSILCLSLNPVRAQDPIFQLCSDSRNYTNASQFATNLNRLLSSLVTDVTLQGFYNNTAGENPDQVYGLVQCRPDISGEDCLRCLNTSSIEIVDRCPSQKEAAIRFDNCLLRFSDQRFFSQVEDGTRVLIFNPSNASDPVQFNWQLRNLLDDLSTKVASVPSKFATGNTSYVNTTRIYGMVQCTRDLSEENCSSCVESLITDVASWLKDGGQVVTVSCSIRYELYRFFQDLTPQPPVVASPPATSDGSGGSSNSTRTIVIIIIAVVITVVIISIISIYLLKRKAIKTKLDVGVDQEDEIGDMETILFSLATLKAATANFSDANKLGQGGFGPVYKGKLIDGQEIAVKRLSRGSVQGIAELRNEVVLVAKLQHRNLVRLLGCCLEDQEKMLVYEYLPNTSLDTFLFDPTKRQLLDWDRRYKIIAGIARGLLYLHEDSRLRIIHRDLKASNILLDGDMKAKISDFGLAKLFGSDQTQGNTNRIAGTFGYMAPEYAMHGLFSTKSDVYSFGVLVLEILTGQKNTSFHGSEHATDLTSCVWEYWTEGTVLELIDQNLDGQYQQNEALRCIHIGLLCLHEDAASRPSMSSVVLMLDRSSITLPAPSHPAFYARGSKPSAYFYSDSSLQASPSDRSTSLLI